MANLRLPDELTGDELALEALRVTRQSRQKEYAHPLINFSRIATLWRAYLLSKPDPSAITPADVAWMFKLTKIAREMEHHKPNNDNIIDDIGYADCLDRIQTALRDDYDLIDPLNWLWNASHRQLDELHRKLEADWRERKLEYDRQQQTGATPDETRTFHALDMD